MSVTGNWERHRSTRAEFLSRSGVAAASMLFAGSRIQDAMAATITGPYGELLADPGGVLDLPRGFQYRAFSRLGETLSDGRPVPGQHDGMAAFPGPGNTTVLVRNHELRGTAIQPVVGKNPYDPKAPGGTTGIIVDSSRNKVRDFVTSSGTLTNCAGGGMPWGTWITCEEDRTTGHGYAFEVMWDDPENTLSKTPITDMGFFSHEAVDVDPSTGIVYITEDDFRGRIDPRDPRNDTRSSFLYRYLPNDRSPRPGALQKGGVLQALALDEAPRDADFFGQGQRFGVRWITVRPATAAEDALASGATRFNRLEGCHFAGGAFWFDDTAGGEARLGQIFRLIPGTAGDTLELFFEATDANAMESPDNVIVTPWGDLWFAEDGDGENRVMGITPGGDVYKFASNRLNDSEFAGPCFSPDGQTFFVNVQTPGITYAVWGPFAPRSRGGQRRMAHAEPPASFAPRVSGELLEAAGKHGLTSLQAAAFDRLGVPLT